LKQRNSNNKLLSNGSNIRRDGLRYAILGQCFPRIILNSGPKGIVNLSVILM